MRRPGMQLLTVPGAAPRESSTYTSFWTAVEIKLNGNGVRAASGAEARFRAT